MCDVGSGTGDLSAHIAGAVGAGPGSGLTCYDVCPPESNVQSISAMINQANKIDVKIFDGTSLPEEDASFDLVSCIFVLHHAGKL